MSKALDRLVEVMALLRHPAGGCPWDVKQDFRSIAPCTLEEAYEVVEAIENDDPKSLCDELGDLLLQVVFHARMAEELGLFDFDAVADGQVNKLVERHPHVFGDRDHVKTAKDVLINWEADKAVKRAAEAKAANRAHSALDGVNTALPALSRALKLQKRAARVGFDWTAPGPFMAKIREEIEEFEEEVRLRSEPQGNSQKTEEDLAALESELGDVLFAVIGLANNMGLDPERSLRRTNRKFERRFRAIESRLAAEGRAMTDSSLDEMERIWDEVKVGERGKNGDEF